jgi:hypothetical protein
VLKLYKRKNRHLWRFFQEIRLALLFALLLHEPAAFPPPKAGIAKVKIKEKAREGHVFTGLEANPR